MKAIGQKIKHMALVNLSIPMAITMKGNGRTIWQMVKGNMYK